MAPAAGRVVHGRVAADLPGLGGDRREAESEKDDDDHRIMVWLVTNGSSATTGNCGYPITPVGNN